MRDRQADPVIRNAQIAGRFGDVIWDKILFDFRFGPAGVQHKRRADDGPAASVKPIALRLGSGISIGWHLCDLPTEFDFVFKSPLEFRPSWFGPITPGGN